MRYFLFVASLLLSAYTFPHHLPDPSLTPGKLCTVDDRDFSYFRYPEGIPYCERNLSYQEKMRIVESYGIPRSERRHYELDHFIPLSSGGSNHPDNIWPQPRTPKDNEDKNKLAFYMYLALKNGKITQEEAVSHFYKWYPGYYKEMGFDLDDVKY